MTSDDDDHHDHAGGNGSHDGGLAADLPRLLDRRGALRWLGGAGLLTLAACSRGDGLGSPAATSGRATTGSTAAAAEAASCAALPQETAGPFPGNGSNGPDALTESGVVRQDIRTSFGSMSGTAEGEPLTVELTVLDLSRGCAPFAGAAVYLWHCDREARYSLYEEGVTDQNYLRGVQAADEDGRLSFVTVFPGAYSGRYPHMHFEVYESLAAATGARNKVATSQLALPADACRAVYTSVAGYERSAATFTRTPLERDGVFRDGHRAQLATVTGRIGSNLSASLTIAV